jgi:type IV secretory pathway VirB10-like protein
MKIILSSMLALAIAGWPLGTQEPDPKEKPKQEEPKKQPPKQQPDETPQPKPKPEKPKQEPAPPPKQQKPDEKQQQQDEKERQKQQKEEAKREKNRPPQQQNTQPDNRKQSGAQAKGQRIPPEKFRASFGREHHFRVAHRDDRRFQYSGYWFEVVEVWPAGWSFDDDCYIEEDGDDYYLVDIVHPGIRVLVIVVSG